MGVGCSGYCGARLGGWRRGEAAEGLIEQFGGDGDRVDVIDFSLLGGTFDGGEFECAKLGENVDEAGEGVGADAGLFAIGVPVIGFGYGRDLGSELLQVGVIDVGGLMLAVQEGDGVGDARDEAVDGEAVVGDVDSLVAGAGEVFLEAVCLVEREG